MCPTQTHVLTTTALLAIGVRPTYPTPWPCITQAHASTALDAVLTRAKATASAFSSVMRLIGQAAYKGELDSSECTFMGIGLEGWLRR